MSHAGTSLPTRTDSLWLYLTGAILALVLGLAVVSVEQPLMVLAAVFLLLFAFAVLRRPEIGLLAILVATSTVIAEKDMVRIPAGIVRLYVPDAILLALLGLIILRLLTNRGFSIVRTPLDLPLLLFLGLALVSTLLGIATSDTDVKIAISEIRYVSYYLTFFAVTQLIRDRRHVAFLLSGIFILAALVAIFMTWQFLLGEHMPLLAGRVEALVTAGKEYTEITRIRPPGETLTLAAFMISAAALILSRITSTRFLCLLPCGLFGFAVVLPFDRSLWIGIGVAFALLLYLIRRLQRRSVAGWVFVALLATLLLVLLPRAIPDSKVARLVGAILERLGTLASSRTLWSQESTWGWRYFEYEHAVPQIASHPLLGLGLGARFRPFLSEIDDWKERDLTTYIHNGHLWIMMKVGLPGYLCLLWLSVVFLQRALTSWRHLRTAWMSATVAGVGMAYLAILISSVSHPWLMEWNAIPIVGIMLGLGEVLLRTDSSHERASDSRRNLRGFPGRSQDPTHR